MGCDPVPDTMDAAMFACGPGPRYCCEIPAASGNDIVAAIVTICTPISPVVADGCYDPTCPITVTGAVDKGGQCCAGWSDGERYPETGRLANSIYGATEIGRITIKPPPCGECIRIDSAKRTVTRIAGNQELSALDYITFPDGDIGTVQWMINTFCFPACICASLHNYGPCSLPLTGIEVEVEYVKVTK